MRNLMMEANVVTEENIIHEFVGEMAGSSMQDSLVSAVDSVEEYHNQTIIDNQDFDLDNITLDDDIRMSWKNQINHKQNIWPYN